MKTIFVSSTFRDFQQERDVLHDQVLPRLNAQGRAYGEEVSFCDLRWGVDTSNEADEEESSAKVLTVCMNEIDRSRPYMIVLLGERYGFMPGAAAIGREARRKEMSLEELEISVTALEIEYGALLNENSLQNTWFYFRELESEKPLPKEFLPESQAHQEKLDALKTRIRRMAGDRVRFYKAIWKDGAVEELSDFASQVEQDIKEQLKSEWEAYEKLDMYERDALSQWNYLEGKARSFSVFSHFAEEINSRLLEEESMIAIKGDSGSGKSTLFARVCLDLRERGFLVLPFSCGNTSLSTDAFGILRSLVWQLEAILQEEHLEDLEKREEKPRSAEEWRKQLDELCVRMVSLSPLLIAVDALEQMQAGEMRDLLEFLPSVRPRGLSVLVTCLSDFNLSEFIFGIPMPKMNAYEREKVVDGILASMGKELASPVVKTLVEKGKGNTPLYLYLAVSRLTLMNAADFHNIQVRGDGIEAITAQQLELIKTLPEDLEELGAFLLDAVGERIAPDMCRRASALLAISRHGLRLSDLEGLFGSGDIAFSTLEFAGFVNYLNDLFLMRADGRYDFLHKNLRLGMLRLLEQENTDLREIHEELASYFASLPMDDEIRIQELTWESMQADDVSTFIYWLSCVCKKSQRGEKETARDIARYSREDGGAWIEACLKGLWELEWKEEWGLENAVIMSSILLSKEVCNEFTNSLSEKQIQIRIAKAALSNMERLADIRPSAGNRAALSRCSMWLAEYCRNSGRAEERQEGIQLLKRSMVIQEEFCKENPDRNHFLWLARINAMLSDAYYGMGNSEDYEQAIRYGERSLEYQEKGAGQSEDELDIFAEMKVLCEAYLMLSHACIRTKMPKQLARASHYLDKCMQELEWFSRSGYFYIYWDIMNKVYEAMARVHYYIFKNNGEAEEAERMVLCARRGLEMAQKQEQNRSVPHTRENLALSWYNLGSACYEAGAAYRKEAIISLEKAVRLEELLAKELNSPDIRYYLANGYVNMGNAYSEDGLEEQALLYYRKGEALMDTVAKEVPISKYCQAHSTCLRILEQELRNSGDCLRENGGNDSQILERYKEALQYSIVLVQEETIQNRNEQALNYHRLGRFYLEKGNKDALDKARDYFVKFQTLSQVSEKEVREKPEEKLYLSILRNVRNSFYCLGATLEAYGEEMELREAARYYEEQKIRALELVEVRDGKDESDLAEFQTGCSSLARIYQKFGEIVRLKGGEKGSEEALEFYERSRKLVLEIPENKRKDQDWKVVGAALYEQGLIYSGLRDREHLLEASRCYRQALAALEQVKKKDNKLFHLCGIVCKYAMADCEEMENEEFGPVRKEFEQNYVRYLEILSRSYETKDYLKELNTWSYDLGARFDDLEGEEALRESIRYYELEVWSGERLLALAAGEATGEEALNEIKEDICNACYRVADRLGRLGGEALVNKAISYEQRDVALSRELLGYKQDLQKVRDLATGLQKLGLLYLKLEGEEALQNAILSLEEEMELRMELLQAEPNVKAKEKAALSCYRLSGALQKLGGKENLLRARACSEKDRKLTLELLQEEPTLKRKRDLCSTLIRARRASEALEDVVPVEENLKLQQIVIRLRKEILEEDPSDKHQKEYEEAVNEGKLMF